MRFIKISLIAALGLSLAACGHYHGKYGGKYYMKDAQVVNTIKVPRGIPSPVAAQYYSVPWKVEGRARPKLSLLPPDPAFQRAMWKKHHKRKKG
ncbi:MAG: hypothetical protein COB66_03525 [Coxiella sp. (in: Bacteria)]|nr:MAG: hypothetical protein COB66_03525 [Coxiella sp. (in: g-proteobacteria)]